MVGKKFFKFILKIAKTSNLSKKKKKNLWEDQIKKYRIRNL